ncbi:MAG: peptidoglycan-binding protein [Rhodospirillales bacterium]|nr:peptidoglycan-binding protein [Rhodospirillales bacterium]
MKIKLSKPFSSNSAVDEYDVKQMKKALNRLGYYTPYEKVGIIGIPDTAVFDALKSFQKNQGLQPTGTAKPGDETVSALSREASKTPKGYYVWRTVGDDRVRASHSAHDWETRAWDDAPDPGEEFNCRCWAIPATPEQIDKKKKQKCFAGLPWEDEAKTNIESHEDDIPYPYIDTASKITVGIGINIDGKGKFMGLPWKTGSESGPDATRKEIEDGYEALVNQKTQLGNLNEDGNFNVSADNQDNWTNLYLPDEERANLFQEIVNMFQNALPGKFSDFDCFPPPAKVALMDMIFNLGETKFSRGNWPNLFKAVNQRDWRTAANQSHRKIPNDKSNRNRDTHNQFIDAAEMEEQVQQ